MKYKETKYGIIPITWDVINVENASIVYDSLHQTPQYSEQGYPMVRVTDIKEGFLDLSNTLKVKEEVYLEFTKKYVPRKGDIVFSRVGSYGVISYVNTNERFCLGQNTAILNPEIENRFLYYSLISDNVKHQIESSAVGSTQKTISLKSIKELQIPLPPLPEQRAIAEILSSIDDKIELNNQMNRTLEETAQAIFKQWFVDFKYPSAINEGFKPLVNSELGPIPEGWRVGALVDEFNITMGQSPPGTSYNEENIGIPFFQGRSDFNFRFPDYRMYCTEPKRYANKFDTLVSVRAPVGDMNMASDRCCIGRGLAAVRHKNDYYSYTYYKLISLMSEFRNYEHTGTVFGSINKEQFEKIKIVIPDERIVSKFESIVNGIDDQIYNLCKQSQTLSALRDTLLPKLMSGELRVPEEIVNKYEGIN